MNNGIGVGLVEVYDNPVAAPTPTPGGGGTPTPTPASTPTPTPTPTPTGAVLDQQQLLYNGGMSARTLPGYKVWQSFTAGLSGTLTEIDMGFFNNMSGDGQLQIFSGQGTQGNLLQTLTVPVTGISQPGVTWNAWMVNVPVQTGQQYTFCFTPNAATLPDPYGVAIGSPDPYVGGVCGLDDPGGSHLTNFDTVFRTYVVPTPLGTPTPTATPAASPTPVGTPTPTAIPAGAVLDQQQLLYNGGMSARTLPGYKVWQSFTAGLSGTLTEIDMGFFNNMSGDGQLQVFSGQGTQGNLLQTLTVPVTGVTQTPVTWNVWMVNVPVEAGQQYTFCLTPNAATLPDPYGVAIGRPNPYVGGVLGVDDPSGSYPTDFDTVFRTYVAPTPTPTP